MITLKLPMPPSVNALYRAVPGRGVIKSARYRTWIQAAGVALKEQKPAKVEGNYVLWAYCQRQNKQRRDLGNLEKALSDILVAHGVVTDDSECVAIHLYWDGQGRECTVHVEPAQPIAMARAA